MAGKQTIIINGRHYDVQSGLPVSAPIEETTPVGDPVGTQSIGIHASVQKSKTLNRNIVKKHILVKNTTPRPSQGRKHMDIARSASISRFASHPVVIQPVAESDLIGPVSHPLAQKAHQANAAKKQSQAVQPSRVLKNEAIAKALNTPTRAQAKQPMKHRFPRLFSVSSASLAVLLLAGYLTYLNMPTISIRVAAVQAGIDASYPDYRPSGYRLDGPIAYNDGKVSMRFAANAGPQSFVINEQRSNLNSSAVLENYVEPKAGSEYGTHTQSGLTIYTYKNSAAWVNGGILYTIDGDAPLSKDQVLRIATSL
ncbi:MAG: hypothetical protein JWM00_369 [Candidatus Saccharibacteria bacterium]|nr:hypothetical protein [Candidatus Saccharibacteria bacterium]